VDVVDEAQVVVVGHIARDLVLAVDTVPGSPLTLIE
jgi:hypothetical protein